MYNNDKKRKRKKGWLVLLFLALLAALLGVIYYLLDYYRIETVYVDGNVHYTQEEIKEIVMDGPIGNNSLYLSLKYKNKSITGVPFVAAMDVTVLAPDTIRISVYEKSLAGYIEYLGRYIYFDKDGTVVESSSVKTLGIPQITGLSFEYVIVGEPLPVTNSNIFYDILSVTQTLSDTGLTAQRIYFNSKEEMTIHFGDIKVAFGTSNYLNEKIDFLKGFLPKLEGKKGTLDIKNYGNNVKTYTFEPQK